MASSSMETSAPGSSTLTWSFAVKGSITLGDMTMYLLVFKQGQSAMSALLGAIGGMYEDNLYLSTLYEYLEQPVEASVGTAVSGPDPPTGTLPAVSTAAPYARDRASTFP